MQVSNQEHTSFVTDQQLYCYKTLPFGLKNAEATYQCIVNMIFTKQIDWNMEVYFDDMLVKSKKTYSYIVDLSNVFDVLCQYKMKLNLSKYTLGIASDKWSTSKESKLIHIRFELFLIWSL